MSNAWEKFQGATLSLVCGGTIKDRLTTAYRDYLAYVDLNDLPSEIREEFRAFSHSLTRERPIVRGDDAVRATVRKMSGPEADRIATSVVRMFAALPRANGANSRASGNAVTGVRGNASAHVVKLRADA